MSADLFYAPPSPPQHRQYCVSRASPMTTTAQNLTRDLQSPATHHTCISVASPKTSAPPAHEQNLNTLVGETLQKTSRRQHRITSRRRRTRTLFVSTASVSAPTAPVAPTVFPRPSSRTRPSLLRFQHMTPRLNAIAACCNTSIHSPSLLFSSLFHFIPCLALLLHSSPHVFSLVPPLLLMHSPPDVH